MDASPLSFLAALLMGLASSLHCGTMCGGIASTLTLMLSPRPEMLVRLRVLSQIQLGRVVSYVAAGALIGAFGSLLYGVLDRSAAYALLRFGAAAALVWIGFSVAGLLPPLSLMDRLARPLAARMAGLRLAGERAGWLARFGAGMAWGFMPCAMVYGALLTAALTGTWAGGAVFMLGFGLGTIPAVTAVTLGITGLARLGRGQIARVVIGLLIATIGVLTVLAPVGEIVALCLGR